MKKKNNNKKKKHLWTAYTIFKKRLKNYKGISGNDDVSNYMKIEQDYDVTGTAKTLGEIVNPNISNYYGTDENGNKFVERRKEFAFEGQRLFDLNRTQTNFVKISSGGNATSRLIQYSVTTSTFFVRTILPIPVTQVQNNPNMVPNPGF